MPDGNGPAFEPKPREMGVQIEANLKIPNLGAAANFGTSWELLSFNYKVEGEMQVCRTTIVPLRSILADAH